MLWVYHQRCIISYIYTYIYAGGFRLGGLVQLQDIQYTMAIIHYVLPRILAIILSLVSLGEQAMLIILHQWLIYHVLIYAASAYTTATRLLNHIY